MSFWLTAMVHRSPEVYVLVQVGVLLFASVSKSEEYFRQLILFLIIQQNYGENNKGTN